MCICIANWQMLNAFYPYFKLNNVLHCKLYLANYLATDFSGKDKTICSWIYVTFADEFQVKFNRAAAYQSSSLQTDISVHTP